MVQILVVQIKALRRVMICLVRNSEALVEGLLGGALLPHAQPECEGAKAEAQAGCGV